MAAKRKSGRGGPRPGAGPKAFLADAVLRSITFERAQLDHLEAVAAKLDESVSAIVRRACAAYLKRKGIR
jgi:hypothetical protein